jgi:hypothetical protein
MGRFAASWQLIKASWGVLRDDKQLIVFPIVSAIACVIVTAAFVVPMFLAGYFDQLSNGDPTVRALGVVVAFLFYLVQYFVIFFANTALVGAALKKLNGEHATAGDGFRVALAHIGTIFGYALISATVGLILQLIRDRGGIVGQIASAILGLAWNIATYLAVPVLVVENVGPIEAIKRSAGYLKRTWGEQIIGNFGIGAAFGLLTLIIMLLGVGVIVAAAATGLVPVIVAAIVLVVAAVLLLSLVAAALSGIYRAAVYRYAASGQVAPGFNPALVQGAFRAKQSRVPWRR